MKTKLFFAAVMATIFSLNGIAQQDNKRFAFEISAGPSLGTCEPVNARFGLGFDGILHYRIKNNVGIYGGWGWNQFNVKTSFAGDDMDFEETGYVFGLQYKRPFELHNSSWFLRAGGLYNHIEIENESGEMMQDTGHGFGFQFTLGVEVPLGLSWSISPAVKFNSLSRDVLVEGDLSGMDFDYLSLRVGILKKF